MTANERKQLALRGRLANQTQRFQAITGRLHRTRPSANAAPARHRPASSIHACCLPADIIAFLEKQAGITATAHMGKPRRRGQ